MKDSLKEIINSYDPDAPLTEASTIPARGTQKNASSNLRNRRSSVVRGNSPRERINSRSRGDFVTTEIGGEPIVIVRGGDNVVRGFFNVCRHHAAAVMAEVAGRANQLRCPYHGWTYSLAGGLKGTPDFGGVCNFDREQNGLAPVAVSVWGNWVFARLEGGQRPSLNDFLGTDLINQFHKLNLVNLHWLERRCYMLNCNWKVFVDNYLDGGDHVPHLHKGLDSVLDYSNYTIENGERFCLQSSPMVSRAEDDSVSAVRTGQRALYYWLYPNFMINCYEGVMARIWCCHWPSIAPKQFSIFNFEDVSASARQRTRASIDVGERIQREDLDICESVQRGLKSRAYTAGRLSVRREAGEHLFHHLLHADLKAGL